MIHFTIITLTLIAICCFLAIKFYIADKKLTLAESTLIFMDPITLDSATKMLQAKGYEIIEANKEKKSILFEINGNRLYLDLSRLPIVMLYLGYSKLEDQDLECLKLAAQKTTNDIIAVKVSAEEDGHSFVITSCESCIGNLADSLDRYLDILQDARQNLSDNYHELIGEKRGREQALLETENSNIAAVEPKKKLS